MYILHYAIYTLLLDNYILQLEYMDLKKLKLARVELDLSQNDLAEKCGITRQTIGLIEAGKYNPSLKLCLSICWALNKTLDDLFWENENEFN